MFELEEISHFLPVTATNAFKNNVENFYSARNAVMEIIKSYIAIDENQPFPDFLKLPAAWLCSYINFHTGTKTEKEEADRYENLYKKAISLLVEVQRLSITKSKYSTNEIEGLL